MSKQNRFFGKKEEHTPFELENPVPPGVQKEDTEKENDDFYQAVKNRRSIYILSKDNVESNERLRKQIEHALNHVPSPSNIESSRILVLLNEEHDQLWTLTAEKLKSIMDDRDFTNTQAQMEMFEHAYGTILFFEDQEVISRLKDEQPMLKDEIHAWSEQASGMLQYAVWVALESDGYGASLQHYNPFIDANVREKWNLPEEWYLRAQMPFGKPHEYPNEKEIKPLESRLLIRR